MARHPHVLVVEDDRDIREALTDVIDGQGLAVTAARDGVEALAALREGPPPSAVFLDKHMPRLDGAAVLEAMRSDPGLARIPVVWMTADGSETPPGTEPLEKPFEMERLLAVLGTLSEAG